MNLVLNSGRSAKGPVKPSQDKKEISEEDKRGKVINFISTQMDSNFLSSSLSMLHLFTNVARVTPRLLKVLQSVSNVYHIRTLFELLLVASDKSKLDIICIINNLIKVEVPLEQFNDALVDLNAPLQKQQSFLSEMQNPLAELLFNYAVYLRSDE